VFGHLEASKLHLRGGYGVRRAHFQVALRRPHMLRRGDDGLFPRLGSRVRLDRVNPIDAKGHWKSPGELSIHPWCLTRVLLWCKNLQLDWI
jgi:hypothetical protein